MMDFRYEEGNNVRNRFAKGIALLIMMAVLSGCSRDNEPAASAAQTEEPALPALSQLELPVTIQGHEIIVGETTIQELLGDGFQLMVSEWNGDDIVQHELNPDTELADGTSNTEISFWITDASFARVSVIAKNGTVRTGDAPITRLELHLSHNEELLPEDILVDGVPVPEISRTKAGEMFPDFEQGDLSVTQRGEDYKCHLLFSPRTLKLYQFALWDTCEDAPEPEIKVPSI